MRLVLLISIIPLCAGCAAFSAHERARELATAVQDDHACQSRGWRYPEPRYVTCRMQIDDARLYKDWMNLQLMHQTQAQNQPPDIPSASPTRETYRPLDRDRYHCQYLSEGGQDYILCNEDDKA